MASVVKTNIKLSPVKTQAEFLDLGHGEGERVPPRLTSHSPPSSDAIDLRQYHPDFLHVVGTESCYSLLLSSDDSSRNPLFRNGCVYAPLTDELFIMSGLLQSTNSSTLPTILISQVSFQRGSESTAENNICAVEWKKLRPPQGMTMPAGACRYKDGILYCSQGTLVPDTGGLWYMPYRMAPISVLSSYFGKPFNSIQNVVQDKDGGAWFTDASNGFEQGIRPKPKLPNQVYRVDASGRNVRAVADGFGRPGGIALSPDHSILYVSDTDASRPDGTMDPTRAATIYAFDIKVWSGSHFLTNKRVFAYATGGVPTAMVCDGNGNVYAACGDGVEVWNSGGVALGLIEVLGGCTTLSFGRTEEELFIGSGQRLWMFRMHTDM
ncbi:calcium-dependent phosphotriesterase [Hypoxylon sp. FL1150]|nr:calcium-dependent phosphotriesterase [Hypoxylon sp. FL1150]